MIIFNLDAAEPLHAVCRPLKTFILSKRPSAGLEQRLAKTLAPALFCSIAPLRVWPQGQRAKARTFRGMAGGGTGLVLCLFTQCRRRFGSSGGHVLSSGPTELHSVARSLSFFGPAPFRRHLCPPTDTANLGTTSCSGRACQVAT